MKAFRPGIIPFLMWLVAIVAVAGGVLWVLKVAGVLLPVEGSV